MQLNHKEKEIIECWIKAWADQGVDGMGLYGGLSYQQAYDLCNKLDVEIPKQLEEIIDGTFEKKVGD